MGFPRLFNRLRKSGKLFFSDHHPITHRNHEKTSRLSQSRSTFRLYCNSSTTLIPNQVSVPDLNPQICIDAENISKLLSIHRTSPDIESRLNSCSVQVTPELVFEVLKKLSNAGALALSFFRWAEKQNGFKHTSQVYNSLIEALGKIKQFSLVWNLVNDMKKKGILTKDTFALVSRRYARAKKVKEAVDAFERMEKFGFTPELADYNRLIDTFSKSRHVVKAQQVFDQWRNVKFKPDIKSYTILLEGWGQQQNLLRLDEVYREMKGEGFQPDAVTYGIIVNAYCKAKKYDEAIRKFNEMEATGIKPTPHIYCSLISGLGSEKRLDEALKFFHLSKESGFKVDAQIYNALIGSYCWSMRMSDAYGVVEEMRNYGIGPNSRTYDIILHHLIKASRTKEAYTIFQRMSNEVECKAGVSTYEIMVRMFCNERKTDMALKVWDKMKSSGVLPGMHMFSILIKSLCLENELDDACKYFHEMLGMGIRPPGQLFSNLRQALLEEGREDVVIVLANKLENIRNNPLVG